MILVLVGLASYLYGMTYIQTEGSVMTSQELTIVNLLAKEWKYMGPPGILDVSDIVAAVDLAPSETLQALKALYQSGMVDMDRLKISAYLTPEGYAAVQT